ncbi:MAG: glycosyltransferase family 39 protein [Candidatus Omnitrophota bacterium]|jgi:4-amino-4-deoxy-L-arabinose transferase-like glycosyltransferase
MIKFLAYEGHCAGDCFRNAAVAANCNHMDIKEKSFVEKIKLSCLVIFWGIILFHLINNYFWLKFSTEIAGDDVSCHLFYQLKFFNIFKHIINNDVFSFSIKSKQLLELFNTPFSSAANIYWPNLVYFISSLLNLFAGNSLFVTRFTMSVFLLVLMISTYFIAKDALNKQAGLLAMFLVSMYPLVFESSRQYSLDLPLAAMVALSIFFMLRTGYFANSFYSILLGIFAGLAILIKGQFVLFFIWPFLLILSKYILKNNRPSLKVLFNISLFILISLFIASLWWHNKAGLILKELNMHVASRQKFLENHEIGAIYSLKFYLYHLKSLFLNSISIPLAIPFFMALFYLPKLKIKYKVILLMWIVMPFILFSCFFVIKHDRFLMPILPPVAILSSCAIWHINNRKARTLLLSLLVSTAIIIYFVFSYFYLYCPEQNCIRIGEKRILTGVKSSSYGTRFAYDSGKTKLTKEAVEIIAGDYGSRNNCRIGTIVSSGHMNSYETLYWLYYWNSELYVADWLEPYYSFYENLPYFNYLIFISYEEDGLAWPKREKFLAMLEKRKMINLRLYKTYSGWSDNLNRLFSSDKEFVLLDRLRFSNGLCWYIYKKNPTVSLGNYKLGQK